MGWLRAGSSVAKLAIRRTLSQGGSYATRSRVVPSQSRYFHITVFKSKAQAAPVPRPVPLSKLTDSFLDGTSSVYLEELQRTWESDPDSVDESWDNFFRNFVGQAATSPGISGQTIQESMRLLLLVRAYQVNGHMKAKLDPLGLEEREIPYDLDPALYGFTETELDREFFLGAYCGSIGFKYMHIADREKCNGLRDKIETPTPIQYNRQRQGGETLIPGMTEMFDRAADLRVESIVIGMPHRGRLNVLGNVVRKPLRQIFSEFSGGTKHVDEVGLYTGTGDVKYHLGTYDRPTRGGKRIHLSLVANPSHLEVVDPVGVGKTRAKQYYSNNVDRTKNMAVLIHGDGSFAGQGVVYETLHLSALINYTTGGTIDIVVNNQMKFTTDPREGRSSQYCTDVAKALNAPIFHIFRNHPSALQIYQNKLLETGQVTEEDIGSISQKVGSILNEEFLASKDYLPKRRDWLSAYWTGFKSPEQLSRVRNTGVKPEILKNVGKAITTLPDNFKPHKAVKKGNHVRLTGQDVERGTFSHRHSVIHDQETGEQYCPLDRVTINQNAEMFTVSNSSLSEFGVLGFELGYSMENPNSLVMWEAQFGDFANGAQVIFDQFMSDDHPFVRPEMDATLRKQIQECNWQVVNVTTSANYFHVLRRQIHREFRKPLIVMAPKNLFRHKDCRSNLSEFDDVQGHPGFDKQGTQFKRLIKDQNMQSDLEEGIRGLVLCSGKVYYELDDEWKKNNASDVATCRVEQLCPFPYNLVQRELKRYPSMYSELKLGLDL
ncbi:2-oxoglutarate dehydrogenase, E1 component isoform 5 [Hibiscus syriacus]|uniref:2-oxoglutarate dehydrogenase, mitochondrial n=1 Tax=Hibiscus syriacus TaxID=106335 RepID=A0A6A3AAK8_HIBSY|nr:2-oxoglutarate dehydrogenase, E1 component isoform 5 [Hibiscus syriacus]